MAFVGLHRSADCNCNGHEVTVESLDELHGPLTDAMRLLVDPVGGEGMQ